MRGELIEEPRNSIFIVTYLWILRYMHDRLLNRPTKRRFILSLALLGLFIREHVKFNDEIDQSQGQLGFLGYLPQFTGIFGALFLVQFFVLGKHDGDGHVEQEQRAHDHAADKVEDHDQLVVGVHVDVHDLGPALHRDALEDRQERESDVVETSYSPVEFLHVCLLVALLSGQIVLN